MAGASAKKVPATKFIILLPNAQIADRLTSVADKKADIAFVMPTVFKNFEINNPGKLAKIFGARPFYVCTVTFGIKADEPVMKDMLDFMMPNLIAEGFVDDLFKKYDPDGLLFRPAALYKITQ